MDKDNQAQRRKGEKEQERFSFSPFLHCSTSIFIRFICVYPWLRIFIQVR